MPIRPRRKPPQVVARSAVSAPRATAAAASKPNLTISRYAAPLTGQLTNKKGAVFWKGIPVISGKGPTIEGAAPVTKNPPARSYDPQAPPPSAAGERVRDTSAKSWDDAQTAYRQGVFQQALGLGDPEVFRALSGNPEFQAMFSGVDTSRPTAGSTYEKLGRQENEDLYNTDVSRNASGGYLSGFRLKDRADVSKAVQDQRQAALQAYQQALGELGDDRTASYNAYLEQQAQAAEADLSAAEAAEPAIEPRQYSATELKRARRQRAARQQWKAWRKKHPRRR